MFFEVFIKIKLREDVDIEKKLKRWYSLLPDVDLNKPFFIR